MVRESIREDGMLEYSSPLTSMMGKMNTEIRKFLSIHASDASRLDLVMIEKYITSMVSNTIDDVVQCREFSKLMESKEQITFKETKKTETEGLRDLL